MLWFLVIAIAIIIIDQFSKWLIVTQMVQGESISVIGEFFYLTSHRNRGAAFGILQDQRWFFLIITVIVVIGIFWYLRKMIQENKILMCIALSFLLGGAIGNFIDRVLFGEVVDFLHFRFQFSFFGEDIDYNFAIFNLADSAIVIGVALIILDMLLEWRKEKRGITEHAEQ